MNQVNRLFGVWTGVVFAFFYLPIAILIIFSFNESKLNIVWTGFTLEWYTSLWQDRGLVRTLQNSLIVATATTLLSVVLGTAGGWLLFRYRYRASTVLETLVFLPMIVPEVILGVSLLILFVTVGLRLGYTTIVISHVTFCFPFVMAAVQARLAGLDPSLEEAALDLGATPVQALGFHATDAKGVWTHHDRNIHVHLRTLFGSTLGHVDDFTLAPGAIIRIAAR